MMDEHKTKKAALSLRRTMFHRSLLAICLLAIFFIGCDLGGEYDKKVQSSLQSAGQRAVFDLNLHPTFTEVIDSAKQNVGVKLRLPKVFDGNSKALPTDNQKGPIKIPGLTYVLERQLDDDGEGEKKQFLPSYLFFVVMPKGEQKADAVQNALLQAMKLLSPNAAWSDVSLPTPTGQSVALKRMRIDAQQPLPPAQGKALVKTDTRTDLYFVDAGANAVIIGWLTPKAQAQKYNLEAAIDAAMGTLENNAPPAPPGGKAAAKPASKPAPGCF
jgi:hypothetical protein